MTTTGRVVRFPLFLAVAVDAWYGGVVLPVNYYSTPPRFLQQNSPNSGITIATSEGEVPSLSKVLSPQQLENVLKGVDDDVDVQEQRGTSSDKKYVFNAPTAERPQIGVNGVGSVEGATMSTAIPPEFQKTQANKKIPVLQGMVYLQNPTAMNPYNPTDSLVLTAYRVDASPAETLAGAKISLSQIGKFPMQFSFYDINVLPDKRSEWKNTVAQGQDVMVEARICPSNDQSPPPLCRSPTWKATGISKAVRNLPGMKDDEFVRVAASLGLEQVSP